MIFKKIAMPNRLKPTLSKARLDEVLDILSDSTYLINIQLATPPKVKNVDVNREDFSLMDIHHELSGLSLLSSFSQNPFDINQYTLKYAFSRGKQLLDRLKQSVFSNGTSYELTFPTDSIISPGYLNESVQLYNINGTEFSFSLRISYGLSSYLSFFRYNQLSNLKPLLVTHPIVSSVMNEHINKYDYKIEDSPVPSKENQAHLYSSPVYKSGSTINLCSFDGGGVCVG
jgi:hypothetical protein